MLRVLTLSTLFPDASRPNFGIFVERQTLGLAAHPGVDLKVVAPIGVLPDPLARLRPGGRMRQPLSERWKGLEVRRPRFLSIGGRWNAGHLVQALEPVLDDLIRDFPFDVIDASFFFPDGPAAVALGRRYGVPVSIKARGADVHHWGRLPSTGAQVIAAGQAADGLLAVSAAMRADMIAQGMPGDRIRVHHTGVDRDQFRPTDRAAAKAALGVDGSLVLSVGALIPRKGHDVVIDAVAALPGVTLAIAGEGPEGPRLRAQAASLGIADRVRWLGAVPHGDLPAIVAAADVTALASSSEGLANAWLESLACGTPIVITDAGGAREVVTSSAAGCVVPRDPLAFAAGIAQMLALAPPPEMVRAATAGFTWEANTAALYEHLSDLRDRIAGSALKQAIA